MRTRTLVKLLMTIAILLLAIPVTTSAQIYQRNNDRYDRVDRRDVRDVMNQLNNSSAQLERDLSAGRQRRILGGVFSYSTVDSTAVAEVREFRRALAELRRSVRNDSLDRSRDEARAVIDRGIQLDRYLRLRTGSTSVDADLANIRSNLHLLAEAYGFNLRY
jgi:ectoine hydroxylase-related dioxygenase (phytanoyl-CoA dioxygenase family)